MRVTKSFSSYNSRRYSAPWIAVVVSWKTGGKAELRFGSFLGDSRNGGEGDCEIEANLGDIVRWGQKDTRGNNTEANWGIVQEDGAISSCEMREAKVYFDSKETIIAITVNPLGKFSDVEILTEAKRRNLLGGQK